MNKLSLIKPFIKSNVFDKCFIASITDDSRDVKKNSLFVARQGVNSHGLKFANNSIDNGNAKTSLEKLVKASNEN